MIVATRYYNDGKEKFQSHEMHIDSHWLQPVTSGDYHGSFQLTGYGADKEEATANLRGALQHLIHDATETLASLPLPAVPAPEASSTEFDAEFERQLGVAVLVGKRKAADARNPETQRRKFQQGIKQEILKIAASEDRRGHVNVRTQWCPEAELVFEQVAKSHNDFKWDSLAADQITADVDSVTYTVKFVGVDFP